MGVSSGMVRTETSTNLFKSSVRGTPHWGTPLARDVKAMAGGGYHSMVLQTDGTVWVTGCNDSGQLGDGTNTHKSTFVPAFVFKPTSKKQLRESIDECSVRTIQ